VGDPIDERLDAAGLVAPTFDRAAIRADYAMRIALDASLDSLIGTGDADEAPSFDPQNPS